MPAAPILQPEPAVATWTCTSCGQPRPLGEAHGGGEAAPICTTCYEAVWAARRARGA